MDKLQHLSQVTNLRSRASKECQKSMFITSLVPTWPSVLPLSFKVSLTSQDKHFCNKHLSLLQRNIHQEVHGEILQDRDP